MLEVTFSKISKLLLVNINEKIVPSIIAVPLCSIVQTIECAFASNYPRVVHVSAALQQPLPFAAYFTCSPVLAFHEPPAAHRLQPERDQRFSRLIPCVYYVNQILRIAKII